MYRDSVSLTRTAKVALDVSVKIICDVEENRLIRRLCGRCRKTILVEGENGGGVREERGLIRRA